MNNKLTTKTERIMVLDNLVAIDTKICATLVSEIFIFFK